MEDKRYFAIVGGKHYQTMKVLKPGMPVLLIKEPENDYDQEAVIVFSIANGRIGYVANSTHTVPRGCCSAGRLYDLFDVNAGGIIRFVVNDVAIAEFSKDVPFDPKDWKVHCMDGEPSGVPDGFIIDES